MVNGTDKIVDFESCIADHDKKNYEFDYTWSVAPKRGMICPGDSFIIKIKFYIEMGFLHFKNQFYKLQNCIIK